MKKRRTNYAVRITAAILLVIIAAFLYQWDDASETENTGYYSRQETSEYISEDSETPDDTTSGLEADSSEYNTVSYSDIPSVSDYDGEHAWVDVNDGIPYFTDTEKSVTESYESYPELDEFGRCGAAMACLSIDTMPADDEERGSISSIYPTGWVQNSYDIVDGGYIYNRCHLIGWQLSAENANERNLITGTRYLNIDGMLDAENMVADYIKETENHVLYRITPIFDSDNLLADGVLMEGWSIEDSGDGICFCIFAFNVQPGIEIDYSDGSNWLAQN